MIPIVAQAVSTPTDQATGSAQDAILYAQIGSFAALVANLMFQAYKVHADNVAADRKREHDLRNAEQLRLSKIEERKYRRRNVKRQRLVLKEVREGKEAAKTAVQEVQARNQKIDAIAEVTQPILEVKDKVIDTHHTVHEIKDKVVDEK